MQTVTATTACELDPWTDELPPRDELAAQWGGPALAERAGVCVGAARLTVEAADELTAVTR